jgi:glycosyltransferase involved in cell wall biosynthesis
MSAGVPVVASNVGGLPEIIRHGENGLLVDNTPPAIAAAVRKLLDDPAFARRIGDAARRTVMERFTVDQMVRRTMEVYRQVLA